jgi:hypothetical protein
VEYDTAPARREETGTAKQTTPRWKVKSSSGDETQPAEAEQGQKYKQASNCCLVA